MRKILAAAVVAVLAVPSMAFANHEKSFADFDTNGDGAITKAEFTAKWNEKFAKKDANDDGKITKAEFDAYKAKKDKDHDDDNED